MLFAFSSITTSCCCLIIRIQHLAAGQTFVFNILLLLNPLHSSFCFCYNICIGQLISFPVEMNPDSYIGRTFKSNFDLNQGGPSAWDNTNTTYNNCNYGGSSSNTNDQEAAIDHSLFTDYIPSTPMCVLQTIRLRLKSTQSYQS
ncbi:hypothetical protein QYF36_022668 [Acer negundo]|nr:hypothetical protein QYF36_022668 [Acer negundo]